MEALLILQYQNPSCDFWPSSALGTSSARATRDRPGRSCSAWWRLQSRPACENSVKRYLMCGLLSAVLQLERSHQIPAAGTGREGRAEFYVHLPVFFVLSSSHVVRNRRKRLALLLCKKSLRCAWRLQGAQCKLPMENTAFFPAVYPQASAGG